MSNVSDAELQKANFGRCYLEDTFFDFADLTEATCDQAGHWLACLGGATLDRVDWRGANLHGAKLAGATLTHGDLRRTVLVDSDIRGATILNCCVCGLSAWGLVRDAQTCQRDRRVSKKDESPLYVDEIEVAQFISLMLHHLRIRDGCWPPVEA